MSKLTTSIIFNIILFTITITLLLGKGINIVKHEHVHNHQEQFQGQLMMNFILHEGDKIEWKIKKFKSNEELTNFLTTLPPQESYFAKILYQGFSYSMGLILSNYWVIYPKLFTKK